MRVRVSLLLVFILLLVASPAPAPVTQYGCWYCGVDCDYDGCHEDCLVPLPDTWGDGIKCHNGRLGCWTEGGACLYIVVPGGLSAEKPKEQATMDTKKAAAQRMDYF